MSDYDAGYERGRDEVMDQLATALNGVGALADLAYLQAQAFECSIEINPEASYHTPVADRWALQPSGDGKVAPHWVSDEQRAQALASGRYVVGRVYPTGSVGFYEIAGTDVLEVVRELARLCRLDRGDPQPTAADQETP